MKDRNKNPRTQEPKDSRTQGLKNMEEGERNRNLSKGFIKVYRISV